MVSEYTVPVDALTVKLRVEFVEQTRIDLGWRQQPASGSICYIRFAQVRCPGLVYFHQQRLKIAQRKISGENRKQLRDFALRDDPLDDPGRHTGRTNPFDSSLVPSCLECHYVTPVLI